MVRIASKGPPLPSPLLQRRRGRKTELSDSSSSAGSRSRGEFTGDAEALGGALRRKIKGEVRFSDGDRALYATDGSNYRQVPIGVVLPRDEEDVIETLALCREFGAPITMRGGGTSLAGQCCNVAVVIDCSKYFNRILEIDPHRMLARVEPGVVHQTLHKAAERFHLTFGPDPATHRWCTIGGMLGNNSCGVHSQMAGRTADNVHELDVVLYDGTRLRVGETSEAEFADIVRAGGRRAQIYRDLKILRDKYAGLIRARFPKIPRRVSGLSLDELLPENGFHVARALAGSEGTCVTILGATLDLVHSPPARSLLVLGYPDIFSAGDHVAEIGESGCIGLEALDHKFVSDLCKKHLQVGHLEMMPDGKGFLLVEFGGDNRLESDAKARKLMAKLRLRPHAPTMKLFDNPEEEKQVWNVRESGLGATAHIPGEEENWEGWEDSAVHPTKVGDYLRDLKKLYDKFGYVGSLYGHFGQGCIHTRINFDVKTAPGIKKFRQFLEEATDLIVHYGGSFSGEHGDGQSKAEFQPKLFGYELVQAFAEFKNIFDPDWKMNPGKLVRPYRMDENLRYGTSYAPPKWETHFNFSADGFSFARATERCVGVGQCRRTDSGTMCPSYMVTREEKHSTRGRAHLLFEMLQGNPMRQSWRNSAVKEALDLCLSCKGCKGDCPVNVDMATLKAEFLSHYYQHRLRPMHAYAFGLIHCWARVASFAPRLANALAQSPLLGGFGKCLVGIAPERALPKFATETFRDWFRERPVINLTKPEVILWPDTFSNFFHPHVARAATEVLEDAGFRVVVPEKNFCCGRPLYDYGMLDTAQRWLEEILRGMREEIRAGTPFIVLEPSCATVFRDELKDILAHDQDAKRLAGQTFLLSEFLQRHAPNYLIRQLDRKALVHLHCHHRAIMGPQDEKAVLERLGLDFEILDSGCCGMAGAFGFEKGEHYDVSVKCGERVLLPKARAAGSGTLLITDGFSCHEQIRQQTGREAVHIAEVLHLAMREGRVPLPRRVRKPAPHAHGLFHDHQARRWAVAGALAAGVAAGALWWARRERG